MPLIASSYTAPGWLRNAHVHTIVAAKVRSVSAPVWKRIRLDTPDDDFLDVDVLDHNSDRAVVLFHGLEGSTARTYIRGMAKAAAATGRSAIAVNFRGCSGETNRLPRSYHSGATEDVRVVVDAFANRFSDLEAVGYSLGGNVLLKYLGEEGLASRIKRAVAVSVPCDLAGSADVLAERQNRLYMWNFMRSLREKMRAKAKQFPNEINLDGIDEMKTFHEFDDRFTAPLHGFRDAQHYWAECSSMHFLPGIRVPTLLLNAKDDPFLSAGCFPEEACADSEYVTLEMPKTGGHVGFMTSGSLSRDSGLWSESRTIAFLDDADEGTSHVGLS